MSIELTFKSVCAAIKKQGKDEPKLIEAVDNLLGLALICSPVVLGPAAVALLPTVSIKNELVKIGKTVYEKLSKKKDDDYLARYETMRTVYGLLVFTSFFDALDVCIPDPLRSEIALLTTEKAFLAKESVKRSLTRPQAEESCAIQDAPISSVPLTFPHPSETLDEQLQRQENIWKQMSQGFIEFVQKLAFWEQIDEKKQASFLTGLSKTTEEAAKRFEAQYFELSRKFEDFAVWANLQAHKSAKGLIGELSDYVKQYARLSVASAKNIDVGFAKLRQAVLSIPTTLQIEQATEIADSFNRHYQARINEPIIEDKDVGDENAPRLTFPKVCDAFVPQAFRVLRQSGKARRLEDESTWNVLPRRYDLGAFLLSYLSSPYSTEAPLLILGHPGSGKSLLTTILSAQLMSKQYTAIRVPLREVNADADIPAQIEEFTKRISGVGFDSWYKLRLLFKNCPPVVILDGYDELLQASGQVFANYLMEAQRFQQHQTEQGWPVRIVITSRVTLIDKAAVPVGSTIVRLLEFDKYQRECWSAIWNRANASYFRDTKIEKFSLPPADEAGAEKILNLAEQPLLLLMLALYDSQGNQLRTSRGLDRTKLYDSLLKRFVLRERSKEKGFEDSKSKDQERALAVEMQRLGVAGLGMYNRRKVHILSSELDADLSFFKLEREVASKPGKALSQADLLLGSFFFVHKSKAQHANGTEDTHEESSAFEFLHNTFGEFLTADFIIRRTVSQVKTLMFAESDEAGRPQVESMLGTADGLETSWFACLMYTPLSTRPVILDMIKEWAPHILSEHRLAEDDFIRTLEKIVLNQIKRLLSARDMPQTMRQNTTPDGRRVPFGDHPLVGHIAIYSINLILLRLVSGKEPFDFDESAIASHEDGTRPWDRLTYIWKSWFSLGNLNRLTAVMVAERTKTHINITVKSGFHAEEAKTKLNEVYNVAIALGDDVSAGLSGTYLFDPQADPIETLFKLERRLLSEGLDLGLPAGINRLLALAKRVEEMPGEFAEHGRRMVERAVQSEKQEQMELVCSIIARTLQKDNAFGRRMRQSFRFYRELFHPHLAADLALRDPWSARIILRVCEHVHDSEWLFEFTRQFLESFVRRAPSFGLVKSGFRDFQEWIRLSRDLRRAEGVFRKGDRGIPFSGYDRMIDPGHLLELCERSPEAALAYLQILRELGGGRYLDEFFARRMPLEDLLERMFHQGNLVEFSNRRSEEALAYLQVIRELSGGRPLEEFSTRMHPKKMLDHMFQPRHLLELSELDPEGAVVYLQILRAFGGGRYFEEFFAQRVQPQEVFGRIFHSNHLLEVYERNPEMALACLQILQDFGDRSYVEEFFARQMSADGLFDRHIWFASPIRIDLLALGLALARMSNSRRLARDLADSIDEGLESGKLSPGQLSRLPISSIRNFRWLSEQTSSPRLNAMLRELLKESS